MDTISDTANFKASDFYCKCCGGGADIVRPELIAALEWVRSDYGLPMAINCGYRCVRHNALVGGAPHSAHLTGEAADIADIGGAIKEWMTADMLAIYGLWAEDYRRTIGWTHWQIRPASQRIFSP